MYTLVMCCIPDFS